MKRKTKVRLAGIILSGSVLFGINQYKNAKDAELNLMNYPAYVEAVKLRKINSELETARLNLIYHGEYPTSSNVGDVNVSTINPAQYPNAGRAIDIINDVLEKLGDRGNLDDRLRGIHNSLPDKNHVINYEGKLVNNSTFRPQQNDISEVMGELEALQESYMDMVPDDLKSSRNKYLVGFFGSILGVLGSITLGVSGLKKKYNEN